MTGVSKIRYSRETRSWEVIPEREPTAAGAEVTADLLEQRKQLEGIVAKRLADPYGPQTKWWKIPNPSYSHKEGRAELFERRIG